MRGSSRRFISAIWNSYSKSDTARRPRTMVRAPICSMKWTSRPEKLSTRQSGRSASSSSSIATRSSTAKAGALASLLSTATTTSSKIGRQRWTMSMCPLWIGSKEPA